LSGIVASLGGEGVEGVKISLGEGLESSTDYGGHWSISNVPPGTHTLQPSLGDSGFEPSQRRIDTSKDGLNGLWFHMTGPRNTEAQWAHTWTSHSYSYSGDRPSVLNASGSFHVLNGSRNILQFSSSGALNWAKAWSLGERFLSVAALGCDALGNLWVSGKAYDPEDDQLVLLKLSSNGQIVWQKSASSSSLRSIAAFAPLSFGEVALVGHANSGFDNTMLAVMRPSGELVWSRSWGDSDFFFPIILRSGAASTFYLCTNYDGYAFDDGSGNYYSRDRVLLAYFSSNGEMHWGNRWDAKRPTSVSGMCVGPSGETYVAAACTDYGIENEDRIDTLAKFSPQGELLWAKKLILPPGSDGSEPYLGLEPDICSLSDGSICLIDEYGDYSLGDILVLQISAEGVSLGAKAFRGPDKQIPEHVITGPDDSLYISGIAASSSGAWLPVEVSLAALDSEVSPLNWETSDYDLEFDEAEGQMVDVTGYLDGYGDGVNFSLAMRTSAP